MSVMFLGTRFQSFKNDGTVNNGGTVEFYETDGSTHKDTYSDSGLTVANTWPVTLNSAGAADIWYDGNADVTVKDSTGTVVDSFIAINPSKIDTSTTPNIVLNGSFEYLSGLSPTDWAQVLYSSGAGIQDTDSIHGKYSWKFTSAGSGGGYITSEVPFLVAYNRPFILYWDMKSSVADVRNVVDILWYDDTDSLLSTTTAYDNSTTNPTSYTRQHYTATPPVNAVTAKLRLYGCHSSNSTSGSTWYDNVHMYDSGALVLSTPIIGASKSLKIINSNSNPNYKLDITADEIVLEDSNFNSLKLKTWNVTADITVSGVNGLDTGVEATSTWYYIWAIYNRENKKILFSTSPTNPTLPTGYSFKALIGAWYNDSSGNFKPGIQLGKEFYYTAGANVCLNSGTQTVETLVDLSSYVPTITVAEVAFLQTSLLAVSLASGSNATLKLRVWSGLEYVSYNVRGVTGSDYSGQGYIPIPLINASYYYLIVNYLGGTHSTTHAVLGYRIK